MCNLKYLGICDFLNLMIGKVENYATKGMHELSKFTLNLVVSIQEESEIDKSMYREMKCKYNFDYKNSVSTIESITSENIQDYLRLTAYRTKDIMVCS